MCVLCFRKRLSTSWMNEIEQIQKKKKEEFSVHAFPWHRTSACVCVCIFVEVERKREFAVPE